MKKILLPVVLAMLGTSMFTSCSNDESLAVDKVNNYKENFEKVFGQVSPAQNFNTLKTVTIESSVANAQGNYTLRVYDGVPTRKGASLVGKFENLNASGTSTVKVDVSKSAKNIYCVADNGEVRTALSAQVASKTHVTAKFDTADGAPTNEPANNDEQLSTVTIAFEDLGSTDDFDFNDAVIKVEYATGTGVANVSLMAVGAVLPLKLYYSAGREAVPLFNGQELHAAMGVQNVSTMINTNWKTAQGIEGVDNVPFATCEIAVPQDFTIGEDGAPFILEVNGVEGQRQITASTEYGAIPQVLVTGKYYDEEASTSYFWRWPKERVRLNLAFPTVSDWMSDPTNLTFLAAGVESNLYDGYDPTVVDEQQQPTTDTPEGLVAVDLGLPSGTLWANMNVGAESPEDYGGYFAWGETTGKDVYNWDTYIHWNGTEYYCYNLGDDIAGTMYDAATANWDGEWCMPSIAQFQELLDNCETEWVTVNGVNGMKFTGTNGKYIFLPASGYRWNDGLNDADNYGYYRSSTPSWHPNSSDYLYFFSDNAYLDGQNGRLYGMAVRPVITPKKEETTTPDALEAVDLGLPSGTKWANMNVGANAPEEYGSYFAWGETKEKDVYDWSTYIHCDGSSSTCHDLGSDIAGTEYDAATANWGSDWQMPTKDQITELLDNTTSTWTTQNGVYGRLFTASNGNSIFLPAAGLRWGGDLDSVGSYSCYWSSAQNPSNSDSAYDLYFGSDNAGWFDDYRYFGQSVRPVLRN